MKFLLVKLENNCTIEKAVSENKEASGNVLFICKESKDFKEFLKSNKYAYDVYKVYNNQMQGPMTIAISHEIDTGLTLKSISNMNYFFDKNFKKEPLQLQTEIKQENSSSESTPLLYGYRRNSSNGENTQNDEKIRVKPKMD